MKVISNLILASFRVFQSNTLCVCGAGVPDAIMTSIVLTCSSVSTVGGKGESSMVWDCVSHNISHFSVSFNIFEYYFSTKHMKNREIT